MPSDRVGISLAAALVALSGAWTLRQAYLLRGRLEIGRPPGSVYHPPDLLQSGVPEGAWAGGKDLAKAGSDLFTAPALDFDPKQRRLIEPAASGSSTERREAFRGRLSLAWARSDARPVRLVGYLGTPDSGSVGLTDQAGRTVWLRPGQEDAALGLRLDELSFRAAGLSPEGLQAQESEIRAIFRERFSSEARLFTRLGELVLRGPLACVVLAGEPPRERVLAPGEIWKLEDVAVRLVSVFSDPERAEIALLWDDGAPEERVGLAKPGHVQEGQR